MTDMDWADDIERVIADAYASHGAILAADGDGMIAAALRKVACQYRAVGMLQAADMLSSFFDKHVLAQQIRTAASKLDPPI